MSHTQTVSSAPSIVSFSSSEAFCRNIGLLTLEEQNRVKQACVAIAGCGGAGGGYATALARAGFGSFVLADHDLFEVVNFNRQYGATIHSVGKNKAEVMQEIVLSINPEASVKTFKAAIDESNIEQFLEGVTVVMDALDFFAPQSRRLLYKYAHKKGIPVFTAAPAGWSCAWQIFLPTGPTLEEFCGFTDDMSEEEVLIRHIVATAPAGLHLKYMKPSKKIDFSVHAVPSLGPVLTMAHGILACEALNYVTQKRPVKGIPYYAQFDVMTHKFKTGYLRWGNKSPIQKIKIWFVKRLVEKGKKMREEEEKKQQHN
ncbi:hypothetical protein C9374_010462 [Naegleria lovaniensis]|uniref:THIF-type NAD/FAD binding fold domain-containing protein n=1 Tax=Naegleria lovaniensis TaxID=51637 RepID=A0AA88KE58_NAELO|nr:uncharacterized protein C9374_010462 [Naegleria lovaniensis]KAG2374718.1 hypothetical protein C9374_010462 [Naegleria lovaniensis]